ncbi:MAG: hypothetical protein V1738_05020 [Patescibacteria group bacterium]
MFEITTASGSIYTLVVSDPTTKEVVFTNPRGAFREPQMYLLQGATTGGSTIRVGFVGLGLRLRLSGAGVLITTSPVISYRELHDRNRALTLIAEAERRRPPAVTEERVAEFERGIESII